ncbi:MAG: sigma-70 family RNA polymerase sigma factor [Bacteroidia bacterium]|nr:sigma-70 family RNA polymerase sigma factor [Bacteroidia bacterium]
MEASYSDEQIIQGIKDRNNMILYYLYSEYQEEIIDFIMTNKGSRKEAEGIFQDSFVKFYQKIHEKEFVLRKSFDAYFKSICLNTWVSEVKLKNRKSSTGVIPEEIDDTEMVLFYEYKNEQLRKIIGKEFSKLGENCRRILKMYYFQRKQMAEIAFLMDYKNAQIAMNKKYKCLIYLKELIEKHPTFKSLINE